LVVRYSPPGNVVGKYKENIPAQEFEYVNELEVESTTESKACENNSYGFSKLLFLHLTLSFIFKIFVVYH